MRQNWELLTWFWEQKKMLFTRVLGGFKWFKPSVNIMAWFILLVTISWVTSNAGPSVWLTSNTKCMNNNIIQGPPWLPIESSMFPHWTAPQLTGLVQHCTSITAFRNYTVGLKTHIFLGHLWRFCSLYCIWWGIVVSCGGNGLFLNTLWKPNMFFWDSRGSNVNAFSFIPYNQSFGKAFLNTINSIQCADKIFLVYKTAENTCCCAPEAVEAYQGGCAHVCCGSMFSLSVQDCIQFHCMRGMTSFIFFYSISTNVLHHHIATHYSKCFTFS